MTCVFVLYPQGELRPPEGPRLRLRTMPWLVPTGTAATGEYESRMEN